MQYIVVKPFQDLSGFKNAGDPVELDDQRAAKLRRMGLIGGRYERQIIESEPEKGEAAIKAKTAKKAVNK